MGAEEKESTCTMIGERRGAVGGGRRGQRTSRWAELLPDRCSLGGECGPAMGRGGLVLVRLDQQLGRHPAAPQQLVPVHVVLPSTSDHSADRLPAHCRSTAVVPQLNEWGDRTDTFANGCGRRGRPRSHDECNEPNRRTTTAAGYTCRYRLSMSGSRTSGSSRSSAPPCRMSCLARTCRTEPDGPNRMGLNVL